MMHLVKMRAVFFIMLSGALFWGALSVNTHAQIVNLLADDVRVDARTKTLLATGNVQVLYDGAVLRANRIRYNQTLNQITVIGAFEIQRGKDLTVHANDATLDADIKNALINGAQALIEQSLRIDAQRAEFSSDTTRFDGVIASTCDVCKTDQTPLWQLNAKRVYHRPDKQRVYFENAVLELGGLPVLATPRISIPEPGITRATGMLAPIFSTSDELGLGLKTPFYYAINAHSDATITPFVTSRGAVILEGEYRRRTKSGAYAINGAVAPRDPVNPNGISAYVKSDARFNLWQDYQLDIAINLSTENTNAMDESFIEKYNYSDQDRLLNSINLSRTNKQSYAELSAASVQSLRASEADSNIPIIAPSAFVQRNTGDQIKQGKLNLQLQAIGLQRFTSGSHYALATKASWHKSWYQNNGLIFGAGVGANATTYKGRSNIGSSLLPHASAELRYPLMRQDKAITQVIEPVIQFIAAPDRPFGAFNTDITTLDGVTVEFEETNLFSSNRFAGFDRTEAGTRANIGIKYQRINPHGWNYGVTVGRVLRSKDLKQFAAIDAAGLTDGHSDFVSALSLRYGDIVEARSRLLFDNDLDISKNETNISTRLDKFDIGVSYVDLDIDPIDKQREISLNGTYRHNKNVSIIGKIRHNLISSQPIEQAVGLNFQNECAIIALRFARKYDAMGVANRSISLKLELGSFGRQATNRKFKRRCGQK